MRKPVRTAAVLIGLGVGAVVGPSLGPAAVWSGVAVAALGVALSLVGVRESNLVEDGLTDRGDDRAAGGMAAAAPRRRKRETPTLGGLGTRVEQILDLAEEQADDHRSAAQREAESIVTAARREAETILNRAHQQAAGISGTRWEPPSAGVGSA